MTITTEVAKAIEDLLREARLCITALSTDPRNGHLPECYEKALPNPADRDELAKAWCAISEAEGYLEDANDNPT